jgi:cold shock CspA family protein
MRGFVKSYDRDKGWGWITHDTGDVFVHHSALDGPMPDVGREVSFDITINPKNGKACAVNVRPMSANDGLAWLNGRPKAS